MVSTDLKRKSDWKIKTEKHFHLIIWKNIENPEAPLFSEALPTLWFTSNPLIKNVYCALVKSKKFTRLMKFR